MVHWCTWWCGNNFRLCNVMYLVDKLINPQLFPVIESNFGKALVRRFCLIKGLLEIWCKLFLYRNINKFGFLGSDCVWDGDQVCDCVL